MDSKKVIRAAAVILAALTTLGALASCHKTPEPLSPVPVQNNGMYPAMPAFDYTKYSGFNSVTSFLGVGNVLALYKNEKRIYVRGGVTESAEPLLKEEGGALKLNVSGCAELFGASDSAGWVDVKDGLSVAGLTATVYDDRMVVLTEADKTPDTFNDMFSLEYVAMLLKGAEKEDMDNAFITLPSKVSAGTNTVFYTEPSLNLGLQTNVYYAALGDVTVTAGPELVAGQGPDRQNYTLVRVFNRQQAISAQFLAYPPDVRGGVQVAAATFAGASGKETLIVTAPYVNEGTGAEALRVYDTQGLIRCAVTPEELNAPYVIAAGRFTEGSEDDQLAVASAVMNGGELTVNIYSVADMKLQKTVKAACGIADGKTVVFSVRKGQGGDRLLVYTDGARTAYELDPKSGTAEALPFELSENATGVYDSAFDGRYNVTVADGTFSYVDTFAPAGGSATRNNVGGRENRFYSSFAKKNADGYVDNGTFHHVRVDLAAPILGKLKSSDTARQLLTDSENNTYKRWSVNFRESNVFHNGYHMWEPCFTHRWNVNNSTKILAGVVDRDGNLMYGSIGRDNISVNYLELGSAFLIGTYADGILEMNKMRIYPLRSYLQGLAVDFRGEKGEPEKMIAVSPVHEQEINVAGSVGDYNVYMIRGFREYLLSLYGSIENINKRFGTNFANEDEFDAPRFDPKKDDPSECRGQWDRYGDSDFFTQWSLYTRFIVNKRIMEAYREALLAGFPPESINAHQIPEGDAVSGFLGEADTRLSPIEAVTVCGTAYGGTRYGVYYKDDNNFLNQAFKAGHTNITLGEYGSITTNRDEALNQLRYMWSHGVRFLHMIIPLDTNSTEYKASKKGEEYAINTLQKENQPRTVNTGITKGAAAYEGNGLKFDIVQMSRPSENGNAIGTGLLKSVNADGSWEGTVYLSPFHANVDISNIKMSGSAAAGFTSADIDGLQCGDQVELSFIAAYSGEGGRVRIRAYNGGYLLSGSETVYDLYSEFTPYRFVFSNQLTPEKIRIEVTFENVDKGSVDVASLFCTAQYEDIAHKYFGDNDSSAARGGVSFDIIER